MSRLLRPVLVAVLLVLSGFASMASAQMDVRGIVINPNPPYQTSVWTDKSHYEIGERMNIYFRVNRDSFVYVFNIDAQGVVRLIYPNIYSSSNQVRANQTYTLPDNSRYNLTISGPAGTEQLILFSTPSRIRDVEWVRRSLESGAFSPGLNVNISADQFMLEIRSVNITPAFGTNWSSATATFTVGRVAQAPTPIIPIPPAPPAPVVPVPPIPARGTILVTSNPSGARVFLDGAEQGSTPLTLSGVSYGEHEVTVIRQGYYTFTRRVIVDSPTTYSVSASLARLPGPGQGPISEVQILGKSLSLKWPNAGPITESFSYRGSIGSLTVSADTVLGMLSRVTGSMTVGSVGPVRFVDISPSGQDAPWPGRAYERVQYPFRARVVVEDSSVVTGPIFGLEYLDSIRLRIEVWYIGD